MKVWKTVVEKKTWRHPNYSLDLPIINFG